MHLLLSHIFCSFIVELLHNMAQGGIQVIFMSVNPLKGPNETNLHHMWTDGEV